MMFASIRAWICPMPQSELPPLKPVVARSIGRPIPSSFVHVGGFNEYVPQTVIHLPPSPPRPRLILPDSPSSTRAVLGVPTSNTAFFSFDEDESPSPTRRHHHYHHDEPTTSFSPVSQGWDATVAYLHGEPFLAALHDARDAAGRHVVEGPRSEGTQAVRKWMATGDATPLNAAVSTAGRRARNFSRKIMRSVGNPIDDADRTGANSGLLGLRTSNDRDIGRRSNNTFGSQGGESDTYNELSLETTGPVMNGSCDRYGVERQSTETEFWPPRRRSSARFVLDEQEDMSETVVFRHSLELEEGEYMPEEQDIGEMAIRRRLELVVKEDELSLGNKRRPDVLFSLPPVQWATDHSAVTSYSYDWERPIYLDEHHTNIQFRTPSSSCHSYSSSSSSSSSSTTSSSPMRETHRHAARMHTLSSEATDPSQDIQTATYETYTRPTTARHSIFIQTRGSNPVSSSTATSPPLSPPLDCSPTARPRHRSVSLLAVRQNARSHVEARPDAGKGKVGEKRRAKGRQWLRPGPSGLANVQICE